MKNPWSEIEKPSSDFNVRLVGDDHPLRLYWGRDTQGRYLFLYDADPENIPEKNKLARLSGISMAVSRQDSSAKLVLILSDNANWELFYALCSDLVRATETAKDGDAACAVIIRRLGRWQELLKKARPDILTLEQIKGLIGELLFLSKKVALAFGWSNAVSFWKGPEGSPQDFAVHQTAVEIKCQLGSSKPHVRVTSAEQLDPQLPSGFLVVYTIATAAEDDTETFTLNELIGEIRDMLQSESDDTRERFEDLIYNAGYVTSEDYDAFRFTRVAVKSYRIIEGFPRIIPRDLRPGVGDVTYLIELEACSGFEGKPDWWEVPS